MGHKPLKSGSGHPSRAGGIASGALFWCGTALIGILAIPTSSLIGGILLIWKITDVLMRRVSRDLPSERKNFRKFPK